VSRESENAVNQAYPRDAATSLCTTSTDSEPLITPFPSEDYLFSGGLKSDLLQAAAQRSRKYFRFGEN
jgi:hypothetical protein